MRAGLRIGFQVGRKQFRKSDYTYPDWPRVEKQRTLITEYVTGAAKRAVTRFAHPTRYPVVTLPYGLTQLSLRLAAKRRKKSRD